LDGIICYIGIGSNLGDALDNCRKAVGLISRTEGISLERVSPFYKTEPVGIQSQDDFVNTVIEIKTTLGAVDLLKKLQDVENTMGRTRAVKGGPRTIDLDLLFYGQQVINAKGLVVPHPEAHKRRFVLEPLCDIASYFIHPSFGVSIRGLQNRLTDDKKVEKLMEK